MVTLNTLKRDYGFDLFDFQFPFPEKERCLFVESFFDRYGHRHIGFEVEEIFKRRVRERLLTLMPKYIPLFASINNFENPFVNYLSQNETRSTDATKSIMYGTYNSEGLRREEGITTGISDSRAGEFSISNNNEMTKDQNVNKGKELEKNKHELEEQTLFTHLFTDTPQSNTINHGTHSGFEVGHSVPWNEGSLTKADSSDTDHSLYEEGTRANASVNTGDRKIAREEGFTSGRSNSGSNREASNSEQKENTETLSNTLQRTGRANEYSSDRLRYGLEGVTLSAAVNEWRTTFIAVTSRLLDEFENFFARVSI